MANVLAMKLEQFTRFDSGERQRLDELIQNRERSFSRHEKIIRSGDKVDHIHLVTDGFATRAKTLRDGGRQLMAFLVPGDMCDLEVFVLEAMDHDIIALSDTTCVLIPAAKIEAVLSESSNLTRALWWSTMTDSAVLREWIANHGQRTATERLAHIFCEMLIRFRVVGKSSDNVVPFPLSQEELAEATGMTPVHANRVLRELRGAGLIEWTSKDVRIIDFPRLARLAQFDTNYLHLMRTERADPAAAERIEDLVPTKHSMQRPVSAPSGHSP